MSRSLHLLRVLASRRVTSRLGLFERLHPEGDALDLEDHESVVAGLELAGLVRLDGEQVEVTEAGRDFLNAIDAGDLQAETGDGEIVEFKRAEAPRPGVHPAAWLWPLAFLVLYLILWKACA